MQNDEIWVKRSPGIFALGVPLILMCAGESKQNHWWGEYYIMVSGKHSAFYGQHSSFDASNIPQEIAVVDLGYMKAELEQQVQCQVSVHCFDVFEKTNNDLYLQKMELMDGEKADVVRLWLRGEFHREIAEIGNRTQCTALRTYLAEVTRLGHITRS